MEKQTKFILLLHLKQSFGKKKAIVYGAQHVTADFILTLDADTNFNTDFLQNIVTPMKKINLQLLLRTTHCFPCKRTITIGLVMASQ